MNATGFETSEKGFQSASLSWSTPNRHGTTTMDYTSRGYGRRWRYRSMGSSSMDL